jgi:hypothetical protein
MKIRLTYLPLCAVAAFCVFAVSTWTAKSQFRFAAVNTNSLGLWEGERPVLVYNHGVILKPGVPADRARSSYVHPIYGLDGEVLTDDFPVDHYHHRGLFWAWPHVKVGDEEFDLWMLKGIRHQFEQWLARDGRSDSAVLGVQNGWFVGNKKVVDEQVWLRVLPANSEGRAIDVELTLVPWEKPLTLRGAEGKSYGGLTIRYAPRTNTVVTTPQGSGKEDLSMARLAWADLSAQFPDAKQPSGAAIFIAPMHPGFPPQWLTRHYGALCVGWPGVEAKTFAPKRPIHCRYRLWIHRGTPDGAQAGRAYENYSRAISNTPPLSAPAGR